MEGLSKYDLSAVVDSVVAADRAGDDWQERGDGATWRASSLGNCPRSQVLGAIGVPTTKVYDPKGLRIFAMGDLLHGWLADVFNRAGILAATEVPLRSVDHDLAGHADAYVYMPMLGTPVTDDKRSVGVEVKTSNSQALGYIANEGPKPEHILQVGAYMLMANRGQSPVPPPDDWVLLYLGKDYAGMLAYDASPTWELAAEQAVALLNASMDQHTLPPCTCTTQYGGTGPFYCGYLDREEDVKRVAAVGQGSSATKKSVAPRVMCCARSPEGVARAERAWEGAELDA